MRSGSVKRSVRQGLLAAACALSVWPVTAGTTSAAADAGTASVAVDWKQSIGPFTPTTPVQGQDGNLYITGVSAPYLDGQADNLTALHADGSRLWTMPLEDALFPPALGGDGTLYAADGRLLAIDGITGQIKWELALPGVRLSGQPVLHDGILYVTDFDGGRLYAVDLEGHKLWDTAIARPSNRLSPIAFDGQGNSYIVSTDLTMDSMEADPNALPSGPPVFHSILHAMNKDGAPLWQLKLDGLEPMNEAPSITPANDIIVGKNLLFVVSQAGKLRWSSPLQMVSNPNDAAVWNGSIYYAYYDSVRVLSLAGREQQSFRAGGNLQGRLWLSLRNGAAYGWLENGALGAWNMTGTQRFMYKPSATGKVAARASVIADKAGVLYTGYAVVQSAGTTEGFVIAFEDKTAAKGTSSVDTAIYIDQDKLALQGKPEQLKGSMFVPMREIFAGLGATLSYDARTKTIQAAKGETRLTYTIGALSAKINGRTVQLGVPGQVIGSRTMVPLRFVSEAFGYAVIWDAPSNAIKIVTR
ncbi:stalk domain-containing protein [Paenibacillus sacheonensis]|uniref:PQQ-binding-like beta-propeller repeat protein n=1 Tax=Paenibacillus sacheonensis TaxID=742054 RepID=A0A7X4YR54_9BACL|nr:stalk domain-containing protein [Paenibacillus sacheonensis]MBM7567046.1 outer membrane protein assembly factor BamB [Paenibacillus sacheonensis]NBC71022.1 PQQ-binding-like beta-propeller repeat protein [Paenibacillus sacheonensis]